MVMLLSGYWHQLRELTLRENEAQRSIRNWAGLFQDMLFMWIVLLSYLIFDLPFSIGVAVAIGWIILFERIPVLKLKKYICEGSSLELTVLILGIMIFKSAVDAGGIMVAAIDWIVSLGTPVIIPVVLIPFLIGFVFGNYAGAMALSFTFLGGFSKGIIYLVSINIITRIGCLLSPVNSSRLLTIKYFSGNDNILLRKVLYSFIPTVVLLIIYLAVVLQKGLIV